MRNYIRKSCIITDKILPFVLILSVVFASMISMFSVNNVYAATGEPANAGETFYIDTSRNTNWNVAADATSPYHLYASFINSSGHKMETLQCSAVDGVSNLFSVAPTQSGAGAVGINLFVARKNTIFPETASDNGHTRVFFENTSNWSSVYAYAWTGSNKNAVFPGAKMTQIKTVDGNPTDYYYYDVEDTYTNIIFSNGTTTTKTSDLVIPSTNNSVYVWNASAPTSTRWATTPYILYDASVDLTSRESGANEIYIQSGNVATLSRYKYGWTPENNNGNVNMVTVYLYNLSWYSSSGSAPYVTYDYADFMRTTVQMTAVAGEPGFYTVQVPTGSTIVFKRTQSTTTNVSTRQSITESVLSYTDPCFVMNTSGADYWCSKADALSNYYDYYVEDNFTQSNILGVEATYFDYLSDEELSKGWLKPIKAGTDGSDKGGAADDWFPFDKFNEAISSVASSNSSLWKYPLYFGNFCNTSDAYQNSAHGGPYSEAIKNLTNFNYYANNSNGLIDKNGKSGTTESFSASLHGLAYNKLNADGNIQYANGHTMPYFDGKWLKDKKVGKTIKSYFPFEAKKGTGDVTSYIFNSASSTDTRKDNVYFTWNSDGTPKNVNYGSGTNYSVLDGKQNFLGETPGYGMFPFNNTSYENAKNPGNGNLDYGFGVRLDIDFRVPENGLLSNRSPVTFDFKGDDDLWVYITDTETNESQLVLDLGGVHSQTEGNINFSTMKATDYDANEFTNAADISDRMYITDSYNWGQIYVWAWDNSNNGDWYKAQYDSSYGKYYVYQSQRGSSGRALSTKTKFLLASDNNYSNQTADADLAGHFGKNTYTNNPSYTDSVGGSPLKYYASTTKNFGFESNGNGTYKHLDPDKTYHMTVFYMERGMIESNFNVEFTMTPANNDVKVNKEVRTQTTDEKGVTTDIVNHALVKAVKDSTSFDFIPYENGKTVSGSNSLTYTINESSTKQSVTATNNTFKLTDGDTADFDGEFTLDSNVNFEEKVTSGIHYDTSWEVHDVANDNLISSGKGTSSQAFTLRNSQHPNDNAEYLVNFVNTPLTADVNLEKLVQDTEGNTLDSNEITDTFPFYVTVDLGDGKGYTPYPLSYEIVHYDGSKAVLQARARDGYLTFGSGDKVTLQDIPVGAKIKIVEGTKAGYLPISCTVTGSTENSNTFSTDRTVEFTIVENTNVVFTNKQNPTTSSLSAVKLLDGVNYTGSLFSFNLEGLSETKYNDSEGKEVTTQDLTGQSLTVNSVQNGNISFVNRDTTNPILNFSTMGIYRYKIYENPVTNNTDNAYNADTKVYLAEIDVTGEGSELVTGNAVYYRTPDSVTSSTSDSELQQYFTNEYKLTETPTFSNTTQKGKVTVNKSNQNNEKLSGVEFTIYKTTGDGGNLGNVYMTGKTDENGQIVFENIQIFQDGYQTSGNPQSQWYCLVESSPKGGYSSNLTKHYFKLPMSGDDGNLHYEIEYSYVNGKVVMPDASGSGMNGFITAGAWILGFGLLITVGYILFLFYYSRKNRRSN